MRVSILLFVIVSLFLSLTTAIKATKYDATVYYSFILEN